MHVIAKALAFQREGRSKTPKGTRWLPLTSGRAVGRICVFCIVCMSKNVIFFLLSGIFCFFKVKKRRNNSKFPAAFLLLESFSGLPQSYIVADCHG